MATIAEKELRAVMTLTGGPPPQLTLKEAASQTFVKGELVYISGGYVTEIGSSGAVAVATDPVIYGVAAQDAHNDDSNGDSDVSVFLITPQTLFEANYKASGSNKVVAQTDLGTVAGLYRDTGDSKVYVDSGAKTPGTNVLVFVHRLAKDSAIGDTNARVLFTFFQNNIQFAGTS